MPYLYSTASIPVVFTLETGEAIEVPGRANVSNKHLWTPRGVALEVTSEQLEGLKKLPSFASRVTDGFYSFSTFEKDPNQVAKDMAGADGAAQIDPDKLGAGSAKVSKAKK